MAECIGGRGRRSGRPTPPPVRMLRPPAGYKAALPAWPDKVLASCDVTSGPRGCTGERTRQRVKDGTWALGPAELQPRAASRTCSAPEQRKTVSWIAAGGAQRGPRSTLAASRDWRQPWGSGNLRSWGGRRPSGASWPRAAAWPRSAALVKETLRRRGQRLSQSS